MKQRRRAFARRRCCRFGGKNALSQMIEDRENIHENIIDLLVWVLLGRNKMPVCDLYFSTDSVSFVFLD